MRKDAVGFFWDDTPPPKPPKAEKIKRQPPEPTWLLPTYLPHLEQARNFQIDLYSDMELLAAARNGERLVFDIECYENYFLAAFMGAKTKKIVYLELSNLWPDTTQLNIAKFKWILENFCIITFNGIGYDFPITTLALNGYDNATMKAATNNIIVGQMRPSDVLRGYKLKVFKDCNHIDLMEVAPLRASLKTYAGRMHTKRMQDLPFHPDALLSPEQAMIVRWYCVNDLINTLMLHDKLKEELQLRESMSAEYHQDLRSKSDAQVAEAVIAEEVSRLNGERAQRPTIPAGTVFRYRPPAYLQFQTPLMQWALDVARNAAYIVDETGAVLLPSTLEGLLVKIGESTYRMGIGGLHSTEKSTAHVADENTLIQDDDVVSYYPYIILNNGLYPPHLGPNFLRVYRSLVERRLAAKKAGNKIVAGSLKITINGSFGKLGSKYSVLYAPDLLIQVTVTGQLSLLMLIEWFELAGITVVSANTDGIVTKFPKHLLETKNQIVKYWEKVTGFETERTEYSGVYSRDVNNYLAVYKEPVDNKDGTFTYTKTKGVFAKEGLMKSPNSQICIDAISDYLVHKRPIHKTIRECTNINKFVNIRNVSGGAVKVLATSYDHTLPQEEKQRVAYEDGWRTDDGINWTKGTSDGGWMTCPLEEAYMRSCEVTSTEYLGKSIRWYYAAGEEGEIIYAKNGNKVPRTDGAKPLMLLPETLPNDINYEWYEAEAEKILKQIGYV